MLSSGHFEKLFQEHFAFTLAALDNLLYSAVVASNLSNSRSPLVILSHKHRTPSDLRMSSVGVSLNFIPLVSCKAAQFTQSK